MTIRNFLPRFGMRTVVALAVAAAVVVAALLAVGSPASAQTSADGDVIHSATMTTGSSGGSNVKGYYNIGTSNDYGNLDRTGVTSPTTGLDYSLEILIDNPIGTDRLVVGFDTTLSDDDRAAMRLHIGGRTYNFADASYAATTLSGTLFQTYTWNFTSSLPRFDWATGTAVAFKITALPIVAVHSDGGNVQYGGNNNVKESTAEFWFTRTGSTDEALSFTVLHVQSGETATRTFNAGVSRFSNYHWAVDVDESNNPVCIITWQVQSGTGYVAGLGTNAGVSALAAVILVSGPGTTCMSGM